MKNSLSDGKQLGLQWLGELAEFVENPSPEKLGSLPDLDPDEKFIKNLKEASEKDPAVLRRIVAMRVKLNNGGKLSNEEAHELINELRCRGFYYVDLNLSGYKFDYLKLGHARIGGSFICEKMIVDGENNQWGTVIGGNNRQGASLLEKIFRGL